MNLTELYNTLPARYAELSGRVALVTGASRGIGAAIATRLAREGMRVMLAGLDEAETAEAVNHLKAAGADVEGITGNLAQEGMVDRIFDRTIERFGSLFLLVNNAADLRRTFIEGITAEMIDTQMIVNSVAPLKLSMRAAEVMKAAGRGNMVNISSVGGLRTHMPGLPYDMTKAALDAMTRALAMELGDKNIRVNAIGPGFTPSTLDENNPEHMEILQRLSTYISLRKPVRPQDIGAAVAFLASDDADCITGQVLYVDGGLTMQLHPPEHPI